MSSRASTQPSPQRWRIVLVDDSPEDRAEIRRALLDGSSRAYDFEEYDTGEEAVRAMRGEVGGAPDFIIIGDHLPDRDAPEVLKRLRDSRGGSVCPVVVVTGRDDEALGRAVLRAGAQDFIGKGWLTAQSLTRALENAKERWLLAREVSLGESRLRALADTVPQPVFMLDAHGSVVHVNERWSRCFGGHALQPRSIWSLLLHPAEAAHVMDQQARATANGEPYQLEARLLKRDGSYRWYQVSAASIRDAGGKITHWYVVLTDVHEVREGDARLRLALEASKTGIWTWDLPTDAVEWTPECYAIHGRATDDFEGTGAAFFRLVHVDDRAMVEREVLTAIAKRSLYRAEFRIVHPDGTVKWVQNLGRASYDHEGKPSRMLGTITDISDRKMAEAALAAREHELQMLADNTPDIIARFDRQLRHVFVNAAAEKSAGVPARELLGKTNRELGMPAELCRRWDEALLLVFATGERGELEFEFVKDGKTHSYASRLVPETDASGKVQFVLCIVDDVTDRKLAERSVRASEERLARAQRAAETGTWDWNVVSGESMWTEEAWHLFGREPFSEEVSFDLWQRCIHPEDRARAERKVREAMAFGPQYADEFRVLRADGSETLLESIGEVIKDQSGNVVRLVGSVRDITERRKAELALRRALDESHRAVSAREKLVSLVSHDLKNPLQALTMGLALLERKSERAPQTIARMKRQASLMERIIDELLDVAQLHAGTPLQLQQKEVDLVALVSSLVAEHEAGTAKHRFRLSCGPVPIVGHWDPRRLERVVTNLLSNATKYSPSGGTVTVTLERTTEPEQVRLAVADEGIGIAPHEYARVFDWYARAENAMRTSIQGTGVGLAGVRDIVRQHGGSIEVASVLGQGSIFTVTLPIQSRVGMETRSSPKPTVEPEMASSSESAS